MKKIVFVGLLAVLLHCSFASSAATTLITGHDASKAAATTVYMKTEIDEIDTISERDMQLSLVLTTHLEWTDSALAARYSAAGLSSYYTSYRANMYS